MTRVLITGGCGFIGLNLTEYLLKKTDWDINIFDNLSSGSKENLNDIKGFSPNRINFYKGDIRNEQEVNKAIIDCDYVVNLAAQVGVIPSIEKPLEDAEINIIGTLNVLNAAVKENVEKFIHASSAAPLGEQEPPLNEKKIPRPLSPYGASKLAGEGYCSAYTGSFNLCTVALRFSNVYGPYSHQKGSVVSKFIKQILNNKQVVIYGDGNQTRDFVHARDISQAIYLVLTKTLPEKHEVFQIASGKETTISRLYQIIRKEIEKYGHQVLDPKYESSRPGEIYRNYADINKAKKLLGYEPSISLNEGIKETIEWFIKRFNPPLQR